MKKRKMMALLCCAAMTAGLAGCGGSENSSPATTAAVNAGAESAADDSQVDADNSQAAADEKTFNIDLATNYAADGPAGIALEKFVNDVAEKSGKSINISLFTDGTLGSAADNYSSVASGDLDMAMTGLEAHGCLAGERDWRQLKGAVRGKWFCNFRMASPGYP